MDNPRIETAIIGQQHMAHRSSLNLDSMAMSNKPTNIILRVENLSKRVTSPDGELSILSDVSFTVARGERVAIVGTSGSGKSTLLGLLAGLDTPSSGQLWLAGIDLNSLDEDGRARLRARRVGFVFQSFQLLPGLNALENVMLPLELSGHTDPEGAARSVLDRVGLASRARHYPAQLSGGEQQRVAIARAFAGNPDLLFADEPTGNLDRRTGRRIAEILFNLNHQQGTTLVMVTHDTELARYCGRRLELEAGQLVKTALPEEQTVATFSLV
jgi:putative ABC transport system ATP-binding protein